MDAKDFLTKCHDELTKKLKTKNKLTLETLEWTYNEHYMSFRMNLPCFIKIAKFIKSVTSKPVLELNCGLGLFGSLLSSVNINVIQTNNRRISPTFNFNKKTKLITKSDTVVKTINQETAIKNIKTDVLILNWLMFRDINLTNYNGQYIIYFGIPSRINKTSIFAKTIKNFKLIHVINIPNFPCGKEKCYILKKK